jgi:hypothetical protein
VGTIPKYMARHRLCARNFTLQVSPNLRLVRKTEREEKKATGHFVGKLDLNPIRVL